MKSGDALHRQGQQCAGQRDRQGHDADPANDVFGAQIRGDTHTGHVAERGGQHGAEQQQVGPFRCPALAELSRPVHRKHQHQHRAQVARAEKAEPVANGGDSDYIARFRDFKYHETLFELFAKQYEMARIDESREGAVIQVLDPAQPPERKSKAKKAQIAMLTTLATGFALLLFVFIRQALRGAAQTPESAEKLSRLRQALSKPLGRMGL